MPKQKRIKEDTKREKQERVQDGFSISIKQVKDIAFRVNESLWSRDTSKQVNIDFQHNIVFNHKTNILNLKMRVFCYYKDESKENKVAEIEVDNVFYIETLGKLVKRETEIALPDDLWATLFGIAVSHTRALLSKNLGQSLFRDLIIPLVNPQELAKTLRANKPMAEINTNSISN